MQAMLQLSWYYLGTSRGRIAFGSGLPLTQSPLLDAQGGLATSLISLGDSVSLWLGLTIASASGGYLT